MEVAGRSTREEFERAVRAEVRRIQDDDGMALLDRQRRACRLRTWLDRDGMGQISGALDPVRYARLKARLDAGIAALEAAGVPDEAPEDPLERKAFLRSLRAVRVDRRKRPQRWRSGTGHRDGPHRGRRRRPTDHRLGDPG